MPTSPEYTLPILTRLEVCLTHVPVVTVKDLEHCKTGFLSRRAGPYASFGSNKSSSKPGSWHFHGRHLIRSAHLIVEIRSLGSAASNEPLIWLARGRMG